MKMMIFTQIILLLTHWTISYFIYEAYIISGAFTRQQNLNTMDRMHVASFRQLKRARNHGWRPHSVCMVCPYVSSSKGPSISSPCLHVILFMSFKSWHVRYNSAFSWDMWHYDMLIPFDCYVSTSAIISALTAPLSTRGNAIVSHRLLVKKTRKCFYFVSSHISFKISKHSELWSC